MFGVNSDSLAMKLTVPGYVVALESVTTVADWPFLTLPISVSGTKTRTNRSVGSIIVSRVLPGPAFWPLLVVTDTTVPSRGAVTIV